jgi:hypothetical protein
MKRAIIVILLLVACGGETRRTAQDVVGEVTSGLRDKQRVQISIKASAEDPTPEDIELRKSIETRIEQENIGRVVSSGGGAGFIDVTVEVENTAVAIPRLRTLLQSAEVMSRSSFKVLTDPSVQ